MIPKKIHYCWFGNNKKSNEIEVYINGWKEKLPDYTIIEWNEKNFDLEKNRYVKEAYENKKWAFVSDYVRLFAIYNHGGIYLDTDVEVLKNLDCFLDKQGFTGFENDEWVMTGIIACEKENLVIKRLLEYYTDRPFIVNGKADLTTNVESVTNIFKNEYKLILNNKTQMLDGTDFVIYGSEYFSPKDYLTGKIKTHKNTYVIHHFNSSWVTPWMKYENKIRVYTKKIFGEKFIKYIGLPYRVIRDLIKK